MRAGRASALISTALFVLLWSSGGIVSKFGLEYGSPLALLVARYAVALSALWTYSVCCRVAAPTPNSRGRIIIVGFSVAGIYSTCYLLALDHGMTPGALATFLGIQPILTLILTERRAGGVRFAGLLCALAGMSLVLREGLIAARFDVFGVLFAGLALGGITVGAIFQKRESQAPWTVLPLQYVVGMGFAAGVAPFASFEASAHPGFIASAIWMGLVISVGATFLLYRMIASHNLVNVTSLFYLVPGVTAVLDWALLGNAMTQLSIAGCTLVVIGLFVAFRTRAGT